LKQQKNQIQEERGDGQKRKEESSGGKVNITNGPERGRTLTKGRNKAVSGEGNLDGPQKGKTATRKGRSRDGTMQNGVAVRWNLQTCTLVYRNGIRKDEREQ